MGGEGKEGKEEKEGVNKVAQTMKGKAAKELGKKGISSSFSRFNHLNLNTCKHPPFPARLGVQQASALVGSEQTGPLLIG